jgi:hypothetical protein
MTPEQFRHALDLRGSDLSLWPQDERLDAQSLLVADPLTRQHLRAAHKVDAFFCTHDPGRAADTLAVQRLMSGVSARLESTSQGDMHKSRQISLGQKMARLLSRPTRWHVPDWGDGWSPWLTRFATTAAMAAAAGIYVGAWWHGDGSSGQSAAELLAMMDYSTLMGL